MEIKKISEQIHSNALLKGFWDDMDFVIEKMKHHSNTFTTEDIRAVEKAFKCQKLMLMVSEISEAMEADRKDKFAKTSEFIRIPGEPINIESFEGNIKDTFEDELADVAIRIFDFAHKFDINLEQHIRMKHEYNKTRPVKHGKAY